MSMYSGRRKIVARFVSTFDLGAVISVPDILLSLAAWRFSITGPNDSVRVSMNFIPQSVSVPGRKISPARVTPASIRSAQNVHLQPCSDANPEMIGPKIGPKLATYQS